MNLNSKRKDIVSLIIFFVIITFSFLMFLFKSGKKKRNYNKFIVGLNAAYPPYANLNKTGKLEGFDIDVATKIAEKLDKQLELKDMDFDSFLISLELERVDAIISALSITKTRLRKFAMIHYTGKPRKYISLVFWDKIPIEIKNINDFKNYANKILCTQVATVEEEFIKKYKFLHLRHLNSIPDMILSIRTGKAIAAVVESNIVNKLCKQFPSIKVLQIKLDENALDRGKGIVLKKDNKYLQQKIKKIIKELKLDGTLSALEQKWSI